MNIIISDFYYDDRLQYIDNNWNELMPFILNYNDIIPEKKWDSIGKKIKNEYLKGQKLTKKTFNSLVQVSGTVLKTNCER